MTAGRPATQPPPVCVTDEDRYNREKPLITRLIAAPPQLLAEIRRA